MCRQAAGVNQLVWQFLKTNFILFMHVIQAFIYSVDLKPFESSSGVYTYNAVWQYPDQW